MKIQNALSLWLFVFSLVPVIIVGFVATLGNTTLTFYAVVSSVILIIISCVIAIKCFFDPIFTFIESFKKLKPGDEDSRLYYSGKNEIGEIAKSFNDLIESLKIKNLQLQKKTADLEKKENQYRFAMGLQSDLYFEADADSGKVTTDESKWFSTLDRPAPQKYDDLLQMAGILIHPEEYDAYIDTFSMLNLHRLMDSGTLSVSLEARMLKSDGEYHWSHHNLLLIPDSHTHLAKIIGYMKNIDEQRKKEEEKTVRYQKDGLTGLYTKIVAEKLIEDYLSGDGKHMKHALLVIDIDDFKNINDTYGHLYGDAVLKELSVGLTNLFRYSDIIGRIGGDEFVVLLKHITLTNLMPEKADALLDVFSNISQSKDSGKRISGSIGIATYPNDGANYKDLFLKADKALYMAKKSGKCAYCFYDEQVESEKIQDRINSITVSTSADADDIVCMERKISKFSIAEDIFQILYDSKDLEKSINLIMETIGRYCNVSRVYVFQNASDGKSAKYTHEWCADGVRQDIDLLGPIDYSLWGDYIQYFNNDGVFYCTDTSTLPKAIYEGMRNEGVFAFLECAIYRDGAFAGFVGFDECTGKRLWKKDEIDTLVLVARILGIALRNSV